MSILLVEDDAEINQFIASGLAQLDHQVVTSGDGRDGLFRTTDRGFDAIVVDRILPGWMAWRW